MCRNGWTTCPESVEHILRNGWNTSAGITASHPSESALDHATKYVPAFAVGERANSELALSAWTAAEKALAPYRGSLKGVIVHQDRDPVFTSYAWTGTLLSGGVRLS